MKIFFSVMTSVCIFLSLLFLGECLKGGDLLPFIMGLMNSALTGFYYSKYRELEK